MIANAQVCHSWCLAHRPAAEELKAGDLALRVSDLGLPRDGEVAVELSYLSIDPTIRLWLNADPPVVRPIPIGSVVPSYGIGRVTASCDASLPVGTLVRGRLGWRDRGVYSACQLERCTEFRGLAESAQIALLGSIGCTAWVGIEVLGAPECGETVVVTAAAGAVGSLAVQLARLRGARVIGIAGGPHKTAFVRDTLGAEIAIDHREGLDAVAEALKGAGPVQLFFDNVGGELRDAVIRAMDDGGRIVACGEIASGYSERRGTGLRESFAIIGKALTIHGLRVDRFRDRLPQAERALAELAAADRVIWRVHEYQGLEAAPDALNGLFRGDNLGKSLVRLAAVAP